MLTERENLLIDFIYQYIQKYKRPPTQTEMARDIDISRSAVQRSLKKLQEKGLIETSPEISRGIRLTRKAIERYKKPLSQRGTQELSGVAETHVAPSTRVPILGNIAAGSPVEVGNGDFGIYDDEDVFEIGVDMIPGPQEGLFALRVSGNSMIDAMVKDGDIVIMRPTHEARNGDMVAVWLSDDTTTLKYFYNEGKKIRLQPANPTMGPIYVDWEDVQVQGKVMMVIRQFPQQITWRIDAAVPDEVLVNRAFELAVSIRPSTAPPMNFEKSIGLSFSEQLEGSWNEKGATKFNIKVIAPDCEVHDEPQKTVIVDHNICPIMYFLLTPKSIGQIKIVVTVLQEQQWLGNTLLKTKAIEQVVGSLKIEVSSHNLSRTIRTTLRQNFEALFSLADLQMLCFDLYIPYENLEGTTIQSKTIALIQYCEMHGKIPELLQKCYQMRPHVQWPILKQN
ncbi:MAG: repressor LexA [Ardenticatenaceae bacterium]|nr:transcriptional repressor LexA [Anaerolineales bacterium]MCB8941828.1 repressor LexA [Ardenticatenaceae bacterium]MCB8972942.1 repressor LexA [Ardenticatenaceae bacterium]